MTVTANAPPAPPTNGPGLSAIRYRIGTFTSFRRAMLDELAGGDPSGPFAGWDEGTEGDYQTAFLELWAYLADVLTFYQERVANEAFLPTATQRDSLMRVARLVRYHPAPGAGAAALVALAVEKGASVAVPRGFRVGSKAVPGKPAAVFETGEAVAADAALSRIPLARVRRTDPFALLAGSPRYRVVIQGINNRLSVGDPVLILGTDQFGNESQTLRQLSDVTVDRDAGTTTIRWAEPPGSDYSGASLHALRVTAGPFGNYAPNYRALPAPLIAPPKLASGTTPPTISAAPPPLYPDNWDDSSIAAYYVSSPVDSAGGAIDLDGVFDGVRATPDRPNWAVLLTDMPGPSADGLRSFDGKSYAVYHVRDARAVGRTGYAMSAKVTRLTIVEGSVPPMIFPLRGTVVLTGAEPLALQTDLPIPGPLTGQSLLLEGAFPRLKPGRQVILQGVDSATGEAISEDAVVAGVSVTDDARTSVTLSRPLVGSYARDGAALLGNVAPVTQGETVRDEVLGSGDGTAFQSFRLKKGPLTYLASTDAGSEAAVVSTLAVTVNGVLWRERPALAGTSPDDQVYEVTRDDAGTTTVGFGDGFSGSRPPSGFDNVRARYRVGGGQSGNVGAGAVGQLLDSLPGLSGVTNPAAAVGGADPEGVEHIRTNAPASLQAFGRAVSASDYATLALGYPGVSKASAAWVASDPSAPRAAAQPYVSLTIASADPLPPTQQTLFARALRAYLDQRRDRNVPLRIGSYRPVYLDVAAVIDVDDRYPRQATVAAAAAALRPGLNPDGRPGFFAFDRLRFGQAVRLAEVYAALQAVAGVKSAAVVTFRQPDRVGDADPRTVRNVIAVGPSELAAIADDPAKGALKLTWRSGGFLDT